MDLEEWILVVLGGHHVGRCDSRCIRRSYSWGRMMVNIKEQCWERVDGLHAARSDDAPRTPRHGPTFPKKIPHHQVQNTTPRLDGSTITQNPHTARVGFLAKGIRLTKWDRIRLCLFRPDLQTPTSTLSHCSTFPPPHGCSKHCAEVFTFWTFTPGHLICTRTSCLSHGGTGSRHEISWTSWICS